MFKIFARAIIKNEFWEILLVKKLNSQKIAPWKTLLPGWTLEFDEEIDDCLIREIKEETWLEITEMKFVTHEKILMDWVHWLGCYYECKTKNLDFINMEPDKHESVFWWTKENYDVVWKHILNYL